MGPITSFADLIRALWRRAWLIALITLLGTGASLWFALTREHTWQAIAVIQVESPRVADSLAGTGASSTSTLIDLVEQQVMSRDSILALIDTFQPFPPALSRTEQVGAMRDAVQMIELIDPAQAWRPDVQPTGLSIIVELGDPEVAAAVANAIVDSIVLQAQQRTEDRVTATLEFLMAEEARLRADVSQVEGDIAAFRQVNLGSLPEGLTAQRERLADLNDSILAIDEELLALENASARLRDEDVVRQRTILAERRLLLAGNAAEIDAAIAATPTVERELGAMTRRLGELEAELEVIAGQRTGAAMTQLLESQDRTSQLVVLERALPPEFPSSRSRTKLAMAGAVASLMLAMGIALALEVMSKGIRSAAQMRKELGIDPVVVIPRIERKGARRGGLLGGLAALAAGAVAAWAALRWGVIDRVMGLLSPRRAGDLGRRVTPAE
jgi:tyrosine-protein kinase Etk/Wzc